MIQSISAGSTALYNPVSAAAVTGKLSTGTKDTAPAAQNEDENTSTSSQGDTVTISAAGAQAAKTFTGQSANRASETLASEVDTYTDSTAAALSSVASDAGITEYTAIKNQNSANAAAVTGSSSGSSSSSSSNLSEYTESELKEMLENGEITRAEYEAEINSRKQSNETSDDQSESDTDVSAASDTDKTEA
jgi:maltodextrin utilization protein YvdJ